MTTAREQAQEAVMAVGPDHQYKPLLRKYADVASDVWEPIVRPFVEGEPVADINDCGYVTCIYCMVDEEPTDELLAPSNPVKHLDTCPWKIAKEALG